MTEPQLRQDVAFLLGRACRAGHFDCNPQRDYGASSNALVLFAYAGVLPNAWPRDRADYAACVRAVRRLPRHRRTGPVMEMLGKAKEKYLANNAARAHLSKPRPQAGAAVAP